MAIEPTSGVPNKCEDCKVLHTYIGTIEQKINLACRKIDELKIDIKEQLEQIRRDRKQSWKDHMAFADGTIEKNNSWKESIVSALADFQLEINRIQHELEEGILAMKLNTKEEVDDLKIEFITTTKEIEKKQTSAVNKVLLVVIAGLILNVLVNKFVI